MKDKHKNNLLNFIKDPYHRQCFAQAGITEDDILDSEIRIAFPFSKLSDYFTINYELQGNIKSAVLNSMRDFYKVPAVNIEGICRYITLNKSAIDSALNTLSQNLKIQVANLQNNRFPILVTNGVFAVICYSATTQNLEQIDNWRSLQRDVEQCLDRNYIEKLADLNMTPNWRDNFITPFLNDVKSKLLIQGWKFD